MKDEIERGKGKEMGRRNKKRNGGGKGKIKRKGNRKWGEGRERENGKRKGGGKGEDKKKGKRGRGEKEERQGKRYGVHVNIRKALKLPSQALT